jgi:hypothetical protein
LDKAIPVSSIASPARLVFSYNCIIEAANSSTVESSISPIDCFKFSSDSKVSLILACTSSKLPSEKIFVVSSSTAALLKREFSSNSLTESSRYENSSNLFSSS